MAVMGALTAEQEEVATLQVTQDSKQQRPKGAPYTFLIVHV